MGWFSKIENPIVRDFSIACWRLFSDLDLSEARKTSFKSLHDCFTRELRPGLRPPDPDPSIVVSPCDAIIGAFGAIADTELFQVKGAPYSLLDLLGDPALVEAHRNGRFITLRLTSSMYHRFHAPHDCHIEHVTFISGDTWNVNPVALKRIERLFCKNERAVIRTRLDSGDTLTLVPVAAILVASLRLHFLDILLNAQTRGPVDFPCSVDVRKGDELGWFEHGSTIIVLAPDNFEFCDNVSESSRILAGQPLMRKPARLTYVIPDIHGRADLLSEGLTKIVEHAGGNPATVVALGDYVNKGPDSKRAMKRLRDGLPAGWSFFPLKGNHDAMMVEALRNPSKMEFWTERGGDTTMTSYGGDRLKVPRVDVEWLDKLPLVHVDRFRIYVHAGLDPQVALDRQTEKTLLWMRYPEGFQGGFGDRHVVHGHDSFVDGPKLYEGRTNLDTRAWRTGRLVIGVFDDSKPGGPIDFIQITGPPAKPAS